MTKRVLSAILGGLFMLVSGAPALASNTGTASGKVVDSATKAPVAGAKVTVLSASQTTTVATDASGNYVFISLEPDTYTLRVDKDGYDEISIPGVTVTADQATHQDVQLVKTLRTIAHVTSTRASDLVRGGTTSDVYSVTPTQQKAAKALGGSGSLTQAYSAIASVPGVSIPTGQQGWYQSVFIRGGDYDQVGYEFDGIPILRQSDGAPITTLSVLGQQEVQVYTGGTPATSNSPGLAGYINQVIKTGTFPGYGTSSLSIGGPAFYHQASVEAGGATPDRRFSYYVGIAGSDETYRYGDQFNGASDPLYFYPLTIPTSNAGAEILDGSCGDSTLSTPCPYPFGAQFSPGDSWVQSMNEDRENIVNLHWAIPHHSGYGRDDIQVLYSTGSIFTQYFSSANDLGTSQMTFLDANVADGGGYYTGPLMKAPNMSDFRSSYFPSAVECCGLDSPIPVNQRDGGSNSFGILKAQYQRNINESSYLRLIGYSEYTNWFLNGPNSSDQTFGATLSDYEVLGHIFGGILSYSNELSPKNLLTAEVSYQTQKLQTYNATFDTTYGGTTGQFGSVIADLTDGSHCYNPTSGLYTSCYSSAVNLTPGSAAPTTSFSCPNASIPACANNAQYLVTENGQNAQVDNVSPFFTSAALTDVIHPNDRWTINAGARFDNFVYRLDNLEAGYPARQFWFNAYNNEHCSAPGVPDFEGTINPNTGALSCPTGSTAMSTPGYGFVNSPGGVVSQNVFSPRLAATYLLNPTTILRASAGVYTRPAATSYHEYNTYQQDLPSFIQQFSALGYLSPDHNVRADTSDNFDLSLEHRFKNSGFSLKVSPFYRTTHNQLQYLNISAIGGVLAGVNVGTLRAYGLETALQYRDFDQDGWAGELSYTYTDTKIHYQAFSNGENIIDVMNGSIEQYNSYTSACAANEKAAMCGGGLYEANGAASFNNSGVIVPNPYYNQKPQPLEDPNAWYVPYDTIPSAFASANSYAVPDVVSLIVNYKHQKFAITPTLTFNDGSYYGSPLSVPGYIPQSCTEVPTAPAPGASCQAGYIYVPDPYSGRFDSMGSLREPSQLVGNLQLSYDISPRMTVTLIANNLYNKCLQKGYPWESSEGCWYSSLPSNILAPNGPGTQPGAFLTTPPVQLAYPYGIWFNNTQVGITSAKQPFLITGNLDIKL